MVMQRVPGAVPKTDARGLLGSRGTGLLNRSRGGIRIGLRLETAVWVRGRDVNSPENRRPEQFFLKLARGDVVFCRVT